MQVFSVETQLYYLTNQLYVSATLNNHHQVKREVYEKKDIIQLQYWSEISGLTTMLYQVYNVAYLICRYEELMGLKMYNFVTSFILSGCRSITLVVKA